MILRSHRKGHTTAAEKVHFFWHGAELSVYEWACVSSFRRAGFEVTLWSYEPPHLPDHVVARDAALVLPRSELTRYTQGGISGSIAAFTDFFRYELLGRERGWWCDTDVLCLRGESEFGAFDQPLVIAFESPRKANGAVLKFNHPAHAIELKQRADAIAAAGANHFAWGAVGPHLLTEFVNRVDWQSPVLAAETFYPIHYSRAELMLDPDRRDEAKALCVNAYACHLWNEIIRRWAVPKSILPPAGSLLHECFVAAAPELAQLPALPMETLRALLGQAALRAEEEDPGFVHHLQALAPSLLKALGKRLGRGRGVSRKRVDAR